MRRLISCTLFVVSALQQSFVYPMSACVKQTQTLLPAEKIRLLDQRLVMTGRVDTGAKHSSLHAKNIKIFQRDNQYFVSFDTFDDQGRLHLMREKLIDTTYVTNTSGIPEKRLVIRTDVILKNKKFTLNVNLKDRSNMQYKFLIGRDLLSQAGYQVEIVL